MPTNPIQPPGGEYPLSALKPDYVRSFTNRAGYVAATGKQPPAYSPDAPEKTWDDTRNFQTASQGVDYTIATLDATNQFPVAKLITLPAFVARSVNIKPDSGPVPTSSAGTLPVPIRALLANEELMAHEGGVIDVINTDIFDPNPQATMLYLLKRIARKLGA